MTSSPDFKLENTTYNLSIQLSLNGFSFCIVNSKNQIITSENNFSEHHLFSEQELCEHLTKAFKTKPELQAPFKDVSVIYTNELYTFVPKNLYDAKHKELYFKFSVKTLTTDLIYEDVLLLAPIVNLFIPFVNINNYLLDRFSQFNFQHHSSLLVDYILKEKKHNESEIVHLFFHAQHFDIIISKDSTLILCNTYKKESKEDVLYYLLFTLEQLNLSPNKTTVILLNAIPKAYFDLLYKYIRHLNKAPKITTHLIHHLALQL